MVTFLFTDVEGSTRRWEDDADAMRAALAAHDEVLRGTIEAHGGYLFKHTGDGVCAAFASPRAAVDAAVAAQLRVELPVRMGLATGEAELRQADYFGTVLNRAARVMAAGHGGQILLAESTAGLLSGVDLLDLGPRRLRDIPVPVGVFQVRAAGLRTAFPPLRALDTSPGNLRSVGTRLVGRGAEVAAIEAAVKSHRVVTLTGVGGVGKTRLAVDVATLLAEAFPDGVWLFELAAVTDPLAVPDAVASALGITQQPGKSVTESVADALEGRIRLLVFDNCEHVLDAAADLIEAILAISATIRILATSREGLGVPDEQVLPVRPLDTAAGLESAAVTLFVERARSIASDFSMADLGEAAAVSEICRRLDGIPLAIELAASRMASMTAGEVRDRLDHRFQLLVGFRRGLERHHTLRHAVAWSYDLLDDAERSVLNRCSVFAGGFDLRSACAVAGSGDLDEYAVLELLDALVRKSLLIADHAASRTRFSMLETIRQFAEENLADNGAAYETRAAHARHFAARERAIISLWDGPRQPEAYDWVKAEMANLRNAFRWAADEGDLDVAAAVTGLAGWIGGLIENYEPVTWAEELIAPASSARHPRLASLCAIATLCFLFGRVDDALTYSRAGEVALDDGLAEARTAAEQQWIGAVYSAVPANDRYVRFFQNQLERDVDSYGLAEPMLVMALTWSGRVDEAFAAASGLPDLADATSNPFVASFLLMTYGMACSAHDPLLADAALRRALTIARETGNRTNESYLAISLVSNLNRIDGERSNFLSSLDQLAVAIRNYHDSGNITQIRSSMGLFATFLDRLGKAESAATVAGFAGVLPTAAPSVPEFGATIAHLRDVLTPMTYESLADEGAAMTMAVAVAYALDLIDNTRAELEQLP